MCGLSPDVVQYSVAAFGEDFVCNSLAEFFAILDGSGTFYLDHFLSIQGNDAGFHGDQISFQPRVAKAWNTATSFKGLQESAFCPDTVLRCFVIHPTAETPTRRMLQKTNGWETADQVIPFPPRSIRNYFMKRGRCPQRVSATL